MLSRSESHNLSRNTVITSIVLMVAVFLCFIHADIAFAQDAGDTFGQQQVGDTLNLAGGDIRLVVARIIRAVLGLLGIVALGIVLWGGVTIMTSGGAEDKVARGRKILINGVIGLAIIMSSFAIVSFVISRLAAATGSGIPTSGAGGGPRPDIDTFGGSGALGRIIEDHYPQRNEDEVNRNTKIAITFREPLAPSSFIEDTNGNGVLGDCLEDGSFDWQEDCDHLITDVVQIYRTDEAELESTPLVQAAALALYDEEGAARVFTIRPFALLGDDVDPVDYTVELTANMLKADGETSAFIDERSGMYSWRFETGTDADFDPPIVTRMYPSEGDLVARNSIVQISFSEAMDPTTVQGLVGDGGTFTNVIFGTAGASVPVGEWQVSNGYRTISFIPREACGLNSCGETMYCLDVVCPADDALCSENYQTLIRTAATIADTSFEAIPFTGVTDMAGNALDGNADAVRNGKPALPGDFSQIGAGEEAPDNFLRSYNVENAIDRVAPHITQISPRVDEEDVSGNTPVTIRFSRELSGQSISSIGIEEYPANVVLLSDDGTEQVIDDLWFSARMQTVSDPRHGDVSEVTVFHRVFGPNNLDLYYFPIIPSSVKSVTQNCVYPGRGPDAVAGAETCEYDAVAGINTCIGVEAAEDRDTACAQSATGETVLGSVEECIDILKDPSVSPHDYTSAGE